MKKIRRYGSLPKGVQELIRDKGAEHTIKVFASLEAAFKKHGNEIEAVRMEKSQREIREAIECPLPTDTVH